MASVKATITIATDTQKTNALFLPKGIFGLAVHVPALEAGGNTAAIEVYTGEPISPVDAGNALLLASNDTGWVGITTVLSTGGSEVSVVPVAWPLGGNWIRFTVSAVQTAARVFRALYPEG